jgi:hypothetical protein
MDDALRARLEAYAEDLRQKVPGMVVSLSDAARAAIVSGLDHHDRLREGAAAVAEVSRGVPPARGAPGLPESEARARLEQQRQKEERKKGGKSASKRPTTK